MWKCVTVFPLTTSSSRQMPGFTSAVQMEGWEPGLPSISASDYLVKADGYTGHLEVSSCPPVFYLVLDDTHSWVRLQDNFSVRQVYDSRFKCMLCFWLPTTFSWTLKFYGGNSLIIWKKEIMSYKTADCRKDSFSSGGLEFLPFTCRDRLSGMKMTAVQYFTCLMKWE